MNSKTNSTLPLFLLLLFLLILFLWHLMPQQAYPVYGFYLDLALLFLTVALVARAAQSTPRRILSFPLVLLGLVPFCWWMFHQSLWGPEFSAALPQLGTYVLALWLLLIMYLFSLLLPTATLHRWFRSFFIGLGVLLCCYGFYQYFWGFERQLEHFYQTSAFWDERLASGIEFALQQKRVFATFGNPNVFCGFLAVLAPLVLFSWAQATRRGVKLALLCCWLLFLVTAYFTQSRGGLLIFLLISVLSFLWVLRNGKKAWRNWRLVGVACLAVLLLGGLLLVAIPQWRSRTLAVSTVRERIHYLETAFRIGGRSPIIGVGVGGYGLFYPQYKIPTARESRYCHNFLVQLWVEGGLPALFFFLGWLYLALRSHRDAALLSTAFLFAALVFLLDSLLDYSFYFREMFLDFTLFIALFSVVAPEKRSKNQETVLRMLSVLVWAFMILALVFLVLRPQLAAAWNNRGHDAVLRQQGSDAEHAFQRALSLAPYNPWYYQQLARLKFDQGEARVALQLLAQARARNPYSAFLAHETAQIYLKLGEVERARQLERRAVELYPTNPTYHYHLGLVYFFEGNRDAALEQAERALELEYREEQQRKITQFIQQLSQPKTKEE